MGRTRDPSPGAPSPAARSDEQERRRVAVAMLAAGLAVFALLYSPQPVLPQLSEEYGLGPGGASLAVSAATGGLALAVLPLAVVSERLGRRPVMVGAVVAAVGIGFLVPLAPTFELLVAARAAQGVAIAGLPAAATAYLAERGRGRGLGAMIGLYIAGNTLGGMAGRLVAGVLAGLSDWRTGVAVVTLLATACGVVFVLLLPRRDGPAPAARTGGRVLVAGVGAALARRELYGPYLVAALGMGGFVALYNVVVFRLSAPPFLVAPAVASLVFLAYAAGSVSSPVAGRLADRFGPRRVLGGTLGVTMVGTLLTLSGHLLVVVVGLVVLTAGFFASHATANGWLGRRAAPWARGQAAAVYWLSYYLGSSVGGTLGGLAYGAWGWSGTVAVVCPWFLVAALGVAVLGREGEPPPGRP
ncbi:MFS transporter, partial [Actinoalloteichus spitiensis]|uniref:MFS transporter n=1 Tax=Actinoalloteichus spitiensis TaxID=252394 RepID=UPI001FE1D769